MKKVLLAILVLCALDVFNLFAISKKKQAEIDAKRKELDDLFVKPFANFESDFKAKFDLKVFKSSYKSFDDVVGEFSDLKSDVENIVVLYRQRVRSMSGMSTSRYGVISMYGVEIVIPEPKSPSLSCSRDVDFVISDIEINPKIINAGEWFKMSHPELLNGYGDIAGIHKGGLDVDYNYSLYFGYNKGDFALVDLRVYKIEIAINDGGYFDCTLYAKQENIQKKTKSDLYKDLSIISSKDDLLLLDKGVNKFIVKAQYLGLSQKYFPELEFVNTVGYYKQTKKVAIFLSPIDQYVYLPDDLKPLIKDLKKGEVYSFVISTNRDSLYKHYPGWEEYYSLKDVY